MDTANEICKSQITDSELVQADIWGAYGAIESERNRLIETRDAFKKQYDFLMAAHRKGLWKRPHVREALALGGLAQGYAGLNELKEAESYYYQCIEAWKDCPGEPTIYQSHLGTCLCFQGKTEEAEKVITEVIEQRAARYGPCDTTSYRCVSICNPPRPAPPLLMPGRMYGALTKSKELGSYITLLETSSACKHDTTRHMRFRRAVWPCSKRLVGREITSSPMPIIKSPGTARTGPAVEKSMKTRCKMHFNYIYWIELLTLYAD